MRDNPFAVERRSAMRARIDDAILCGLDRRIAHACFAECCESDVEAGVSAGCDRRTAKRRLPHIIDVLQKG